jgi:hypothetical protein
VLLLILISVVKVRIHSGTFLILGQQPSADEFSKYLGSREFEAVCVNQCPSRTNFEPARQLLWNMVWTP